MAKRKKRRRGFGFTEDVHADHAMKLYNDAEHAAREALQKVRGAKREGRPVPCEDAFNRLVFAHHALGRGRGHADAAADHSNHERAARRGNAAGMIQNAEHAFFSACVVKR